MFPIKLNIFLSSFNLILCFVGASLVYTLFLPFGASEALVSTVTAPYRFFSLAVSILVIFINFQNKINLNPISKMFLMFWMLFLIRMFLDLQISIHFFTPQQVIKHWQSTLGVVVIPTISVMLSYKNINLKQTFNWVYYITIFILFLSLFARDSVVVDLDQRMDMNAALGSLQLGQMGVVGVLLSVKFLKDGSKSFLKKIIAIVVIILSIWVVLRSGGRGPFIGLVIVMFFIFLAQFKNKLLAVTVSVIGILFVSLFLDVIFDKMGEISPIMKNRLEKTINEGDTSGRDNLYMEALEIFEQSPIVGKKFYLEKDYGEGIRYSHNIFLDSLIALGIIGGFLMLWILLKCIKISYYSILYRDPNFWICLILVQRILFSMTSGAFYYNQLLNVLIVFVFLYYTNERINILKTRKP